MLVRVLRRDDEERVGELVRAALDRDGSLLHRLEQRRLRSRGGAVDLVGEKDVREDDAALEDRLAAPHLLDADDLVGSQVWRELDALELRAENVRHRAPEQRLCASRRPFDQHVAVGEGGDEEQVDGPVVSDDDLARSPDARGHAG